jgi:hypothetical protein
LLLKEINKLKNKIYNFAAIMNFKNLLIILVSSCLLNACHSNNTATSNSNAMSPTKDTAKFQVARQAADTTIKDGQVIKRYPSGIVKERSYYVAGRRQGECQSFYQNGKLQSDDFFDGGLIDGATTVYYDNGQKEYEGNCTKGKPSGTWKFYDTTGKLVRSKDYGKVKDNPVM